MSMSLREGATGFAFTIDRLGVVMTPDGSEREIEGVLNPGITRDRCGRLLLYPRMVARGNVSRIGFARAIESASDWRVERLGVALEPEAPYEMRGGFAGHGCEDARVTFVPKLDRYVMMYTAFGPTGARIALAISPDAYDWQRLGIVAFPDDALNSIDNKDAAFFPETVISPEGVESFAFFHRPMRSETIDGQTPIPIILALPPSERETMCIAYIPVERVHAKIENLCRPNESIHVLDVSESWGYLKNGAGTPPIRTKVGWLSVFHGVDAVDGVRGPTLRYRAGILINDLERPHEVIYRSPKPILAPETSDERFGTVGDVVFPTGIDRISDSQIDIYYGAADAKILRARITTV